MTKEQVDKLLYPRWIVLHEYPDMSEWEVGEILELDYHWHDSNGKKRTISEYPHIFKKLEWWEHRKENEMPEYVKHKETGQVISYAECKKVADSAGILEQSLSMSLPATTEEYNNYHNNKKHTTMNREQVDKLLEPRIIITAPWPYMPKARKVGEVMKVVPKEKLDWWLQFTANIKALDWWESREPEEMPKYVKLEKAGTVLKTTGWKFDEDGKQLYFNYEGDIKGDLGMYPYPYLPATEEEYNQYIN